MPRITYWLLDLNCVILIRLGTHWRSSLDLLLDDRRHGCLCKPIRQLRAVKLLIPSDHTYGFLKRVGMLEFLAINAFTILRDRESWIWEDGKAKEGDF